MESTNIKLNFRKTLLLVAVIIFLFLIPITTILIMRENNRKQIWAPMISQCPDYWKLSKTKEGYIKCSPNEQKSNSGANTSPFFTYQLPTKKNKYDFAVNNRIVWDGITNNTELINQQRAPPERNIGMLLGNMFTLESSGYESRTRQTQDPNYLSE
jgi:hypothetical protein